MYRLSYCWELDVKRRPFTRCRTHIHFSRVFLDNSVADRKAQAGSPPDRLGGKKRIENPMNMLARNSCSSVHDFDFHAAVMSGGSHFQYSAGWHGVPRVQKQIQKYLLQFVRRAAHRRQSVAKILYHLNLRSLEWMRNQRKRLFDHLIQIDVGDLRRAGTRKVQ